MLGNALGSSLAGPEPYFTVIYQVMKAVELSSRPSGAQSVFLGSE